MNQIFTWKVVGNHQTSFLNWFFMVPGTCLVGDPYKHLFATVTSREASQYIIYMSSPNEFSPSDESWIIRINRSRNPNILWKKDKHE